MSNGGTNVNGEDSVNMSGIDDEFHGEDISNAISRIISPRNLYNG
jgi:hypothetical protein